MSLKFEQKKRHIVRWTILNRNNLNWYFFHHNISIDFLSFLMFHCFAFLTFHCFLRFFVFLTGRADKRSVLGINIPQWRYWVLWMNLAGTWNLFIHVRDARDFNKICVGVWIYRHSFTLFYHSKITAEPFLCFRMVYTLCPKRYVALSLGKARIIQIQPNKSQNG